MTIHRLRLSNFMAIEALELQLDPSGAWIEGGNARGKSTILKSLRAALEGQGVSPDAIRKGATAAEIVVNLDDLTVTRVIDRTGTRLVVKGPPDGRARPAPKELLAALLGGSLDPVDFLLAKPKERLAMLLTALPMSITEKQLLQLVPEPLHDALREVLVDVPRLEFGVIEGHGLAVVAKARKAFYERRTVANAALDEAARQLAVTERDCAAIVAESANAAAASKADDGTPTLEGVDARETAWVAHCAVLSERDRAAERAASSRQVTVDRIAMTRGVAAEVRRKAPIAPTAETIESASNFARVKQEAVDAAILAVEDARRALAAAEAIRDTRQAFSAQAYETLRGLEALQSDAAEAVEKAAALETQALDLEAALGPEPTGASPDEREAANIEGDAIAAARALAEAADQRLSRYGEALKDERAALEVTAATRQRWQRAKADATALDVAVKALTSQAPAELLAATPGIPGLAIDGDAILVDGVDLERLSSAEQLAFAVRVQRTRGRHLLVDGVERLDPEQRRAFVQLTEGLQVFAARVTEGDLSTRRFGDEGAGS